MSDATSAATGTDHPAAQAEAARLVSQSKTSFHTAMRLLPARRREAMYAVYAFCRAVDDIADEPAPEAVKHRELALWRQEIRTIYAGGEPAKPLARALVGPVKRYGLIEADFQAVIDGMQMDADRAIQAPDLAELDLYCARVAGAVGRLSVRCFGPWQPRCDDVADHLGRALQLTNILRDIDEDAARDRLYLPQELLEKHGIGAVELQAVLLHPGLPAVCRDLAELARDHFTAAAVAMRDCPRETMRPAAMMGGVYRATLDRLERRGWSPPRAPVKVPKLIKLWIALRHLWF